MAKQRGLGKGLSALISESTAQTAQLETEAVEKSSSPTSTTTAPIDTVYPNPFQPRKTIDEEKLSSLAESIREHGIVQPILVRRTGSGYQIVAGERRWRAANIAGLKEVPIHVLELTDAQAMEIALVENLQREDLTPVEVAVGIKDMITKLSLTHEEAAEKLGISRASVTNKLRLLQLPEEVLSMLGRDEITEGHARALLGLTDTNKIMLFAKEAVEKELNVRQLERLVRTAEAAKQAGAALPKRPEEEEPEILNAIEHIKRNYKLTVKIAGNRKNMGLLIKGLKKWQVQLLLEYIEKHNEELFPRE